MRIRRRRRNSTGNETGGEDSFLDIVANLVGVLIILVVVVGAKAGSQIYAQAMTDVDQVELADLETQKRKVVAHSLSLKKDNHQLERKIQQEDIIADQRAAQRDRMLVQLAAGRQELERRKESLSVDHQKVLDQASQLAELRTRYRSIDSEFTALKAQTSNNEVIEHYPTPIAKTVFSDEVHFRLSNGRLVHVPMNELIELMRDEWKEKARKLATADETIETVGPIGDFRLQYLLRAENRAVPSGYGQRTERVTEFMRFVMVPVREPIGVPVEAAFQPDSEFNQWIGRADPANTTVSIWVYPDSFSEFNQIKKWLYERGFKTACWPLSANSPISGGPRGYRSTAQ